MRECEHKLRDRERDIRKIKFLLLFYQLERLTFKSSLSSFYLVKSHSDREKVKSLKSKVFNLEDDVSSKASVIINLRGEIREIVEAFSQKGT